MVDSVHEDDSDIAFHLSHACTHTCNCTIPVHIYELLHTHTHKTQGGFVTQLHHGGLTQVTLCGSLVLSVNQSTEGSSGVLCHFLDTEHTPLKSCSVPWLYIWFSACSKKCSGFNVMQIKYHVISPVSQQIIPAVCPSLHNCAKQLGKVIVISF